MCLFVCTLSWRKLVQAGASWRVEVSALGPLPARWQHGDARSTVADGQWPLNCTIKTRAGRDTAATRVDPRNTKRQVAFTGDDGALGSPRKGFAAGRARLPHAHSPSRPPARSRSRPAAAARTRWKRLAACANRGRGRSGDIAGANHTTRRRTFPPPRPGRPRRAAPVRL